MHIIKLKATTKITKQSIMVNKLTKKIKQNHQKYSINANEVRKKRKMETKDRYNGEQITK